MVLKVNALRMSDHSHTGNQPAVYISTVVTFVSRVLLVRGLDWSSLMWEQGTACVRSYGKCDVKLWLEVMPRDITGGGDVGPITMSWVDGGPAQKIALTQWSLGRGP